jgi:hypothetical protein
MLCLCPALSRGQQASPSSASGSAAPAAVGDLQPLMATLNEVVTSTRVSLARLRIDKWKTQSEVKQRMQSDAQSIERNLTQALPSLVQDLQASPQSLSANFVMYRNLDALHDVLNFLTQTAGAAAPEDEFSSLAKDAGRWDELRRAFADRMQNLSQAKDADLTRLLQAVSEKAQAPPSPPKRIVVDDTPPPKAQPSAPKRKPR